MNRYNAGVKSSPGKTHHHHRHHHRYDYDSDDDDDDGESSTHSVRVSRLIEKIKSQNFTGSRIPNSNDFNYFDNRGNTRDDNNSLIYSTIRKNQDERKRTVHERVARSSQQPLQHKTTVLLNNDEQNLSSFHRGDSTPLYSSRYVSPPRNVSPPPRNVSPPPPRNNNNTPRTTYFGDSSYEHSGDQDRSYGIKRGSDDRSTSNLHYSTLKSSRTSSIPKIILHEQTVADIPNGRNTTTPRTRSPSVQRDINTTDEEDTKTRFLGGFLTLKRKPKHRASAPRSPTPRSRAGSYLNVPGASNTHSREYDSSSSPKYYVPYRSTPTLYESKYERDRHSSNGSVLSNTSLVNKHVTRSMSVKAPWEPRHRVSEINYFDNRQFTPVHEAQEKTKTKPNLSRSKSMPGKKLTSIIGSWVSSSRGDRNKKEKAPVTTANDQERLLTEKETRKKKEPRKFGSLFRFGGSTSKSNGKSREVHQREDYEQRSVSPERPVRKSRDYGTQQQQQQQHGTLQRGAAQGTLRRSQERDRQNQRYGTLSRNNRFYD